MTWVATVNAAFDFVNRYMSTMAHCKPVGSNVFHDKPNPPNAYFTLAGSLHAKEIQWFNAGNTPLGQDSLVVDSEWGPVGVLVDEAVGRKTPTTLVHPVGTTKLAKHIGNPRLQFHGYLTIRNHGLGNPGQLLYAEATLDHISSQDEGSLTISPTLATKIVGCIVSDNDIYINPMNKDGY